MAKKDEQITGQLILDEVDQHGHTRRGIPRWFYFVSIAAIILGIAGFVTFPIVFLSLGKAFSVGAFVGGCLGSFGVTVVGAIGYSASTLIKPGHYTADKNAWNKFQAGMDMDAKQQCDNLKAAYEQQREKREQLSDLLDKVRKLNEKDLQKGIPEKLMQEIRTELPKETEIKNLQDLEGVKNSIEEKFWAARYVEVKLYQELNRVYDGWRKDEKYPLFKTEITGSRGVLLYSKDEGLNLNYLDDLENAAIGSGMNARNFFEKISRTAEKRLWNPRDRVRADELTTALRRVRASRQKFQDLIGELSAQLTTNTTEKVPQDLKDKIKRFLPKEQKLETADDLEKVKASLEEKYWAMKYVELKLEEEKEYMARKDNRGFHKKVQDANSIVIYDHEDEVPFRSDYLKQVKKTLGDGKNYAEYFKELCGQMEAKKDGPKNIKSNEIPLDQMMDTPTVPVSGTSNNLQPDDNSVYVP